MTRPLLTWENTTNLYAQLQEEKRKSFTSRKLNRDHLKRFRSGYDYRERARICVLILLKAKVSFLTVGKCQHRDEHKTLLASN